LRVRLRANDVEQVNEICRHLRTWVDGSPPILDQVLGRIRELLRAEKSLALGFVPTDDHLTLSFAYGEGVQLRGYRAAHDELLRREPIGWAAWNPFRPEPEQRNRAISVVQHLGWAGLRRLPLYREVLPRFDLDERDQLRCLVCNGSSLLAWVGVFRREPFDRYERQALQAIVPALRRRLTFERQLEHATELTKLLEYTLDLIGAPAFILRRGVVVHANSAGRELQARDRAGVRDALRAPHNGQKLSLASRGLPEHVLAILPVEGFGASPRVALMRERWKLTPRQTQVLALLIRGYANLTIAGELRCSMRTIELHVAAILRKANCDSRSEVMARFWSTDV
jgi:DNA-binding CsgD family transcriptional regulator